MFAALHIMWSITVFTNETVTSLTLQKSRECTPIEVGLRAATENWRRWCGYDMASQGTRYQFQVRGDL